MRRFAYYFQKALLPPLGLLIALLLLTIFGLAWCFLFDGEDSPVVWIVYPLSAYTLAALIMRLAPASKSVKLRAQNNRYIAPFLNDVEMRVGALSAGALLFDVAYAVFTLITGVLYASVWSISIALYHVALASLGFALVFGFHRSRRLENEQRLSREVAMVRTAGVLLLVMALALSGVMVLAVKHQMAILYSQTVVIANAAFVFVNLTLAIRNAVLVRRDDNPPLAAFRATTLSKTLVQLFFLETTMITVFGGGAEGIMFAVEAVSGAVILIAVVITAISLVAYSQRTKRRLSV